MEYGSNGNGPVLHRSTTPSLQVLAEPPVRSLLRLRREAVPLLVVDELQPVFRTVQLENVRRFLYERTAGLPIRRVAAQDQKRSRRDEREQLVVVVAEAGLLDLLP